MVRLDPRLSLHVAQMVGESDALDKVAQKIATVAKAEAAKHNRTGEFANSIHVVTDEKVEGVKDRLVVADSPDASFVELGHISYLPNLRGKHVWVKGLHILSRAGVLVGRKTR